VTLSALLAVGVLGALFVNTSMQQQAREIAQQRALLTTLQQQTQTAQTEVDREAAPWLLAQRARALHMRQTTNMQVLRAPQAKSATARKPTAQRTVTGKRASPRKLMRPFHSG
jgi:hypothetical protein